MRRILILLVAALLLALASCEGWGPQEPVTTLPALVTTEDTTEGTTPTQTTPEATTPEATTLEETTPAVTEPDFPNQPDPDGTKRY